MVGWRGGHFRLKERPAHCTGWGECGPLGSRRMYSKAGSCRVKGDGGVEGIRGNLP